MEALRNMNLPPGFGFYPSDTELVDHYLRRKIHGQKIEHDLIPEVDIYKHEPWDLPAKCNFPIEDNKWHFFASRDRKYPTGSRSNRATVAGYWKSTGKDRAIKLNKRTLGTKKTLVFHEGRPPSGRRTEWIMHEYYLDEKECQVSPHMKDAFVLCRVTKRNDWALENDNEMGNMNPHPQQPNDAATTVVSVVKPEVAAASVISAEEPNDVALAPITANTESPNGDYDLDALLEGLLDTSFNPVADTGSANLPLSEQYAESSNAGFMTSKIGLDYADPNQDVVDDTDFLLSDDLQSILCPGTDEFSSTMCFKQTDQDQDYTMFFKQADQDQDYSLMGIDPFDLPNTVEDGTLKDELQLDQENNNPNLSNGNIDNGITRRHRATTSAADVSNARYRFKMQVGMKRMVASNSESINQTMKFADNSGRLQEHANNATSVKQSGAAKPSEAHCNLGYLRGIKNAFRCSSAGFKAYLLFTVLVVAFAAVALHYHRSGASL